MSKEVYLAGSISRLCEQQWHSKISNELIGMGFTTYAPAENKSINDKTNAPRPVDIYDGDVAKLFSCDILLAELHGGQENGTIWECGWVSCYNAMIERFGLDIPKKEMYFYTSNTRILNNMEWKGIPSASMNHLVLGGFEKWGDFLGSTEEMMAFMLSIAPVPMQEDDVPFMDEVLLVEEEDCE